jgi:hypothetical protein
MTARVYIIDLHEMDEAILNSVPDSPTPLAPLGRSSRDDSATGRAEPDPLVKAARFEQMARQAEANGKSGVARLHWQMAAKYGSTVAQDKLKSPDKPATVTAKK